MKAPRRILAILDADGDNQQLIERAARLARCYRARLSLFTSCYSSYLADAGAELAAAARAVGDAATGAAQQALEAEAGRLRNSGLRVDGRAVWDRSRHGSALAEAARTQADLLVKGTRYHSARARASITHADWNLVRETRVPLWLVKAGELPVERARIVASVDLAADGAADERIVRTAKEIARALHAVLYVFHAFDPLPAIGDAAIRAIKSQRLPIEAIRENLRAVRAEALAALAGRHGVEPPQRLLKSGPVAELLPGIATELGASLVVCGVNGGRDGRGGGIGSTVEAVLDHVPCDMLVVPTAGDGDGP